MLWNEALYLWLIHSAIVSLLVLAVGSGAVLLCRRPARRVWIIELALVGCLIAPCLTMIPGYPRLGFGWRVVTPLHQEEAALPASVQSAGRMVPPSVVPPSEDLPVLAETVTPQAAPRTTDAPSHAFNAASWIVTVYVIGVALGLAWWLVGLLGLVKIMRTTRPAPSRCRELLVQIAGQRGSRVRLMVSSRVHQPFAFALGRPVIVLPEDLCADDRALRWSLAHEWTHIERHDFRAWLAAGLARVIFFYHPLVWWLRRQLRLSQDFLADDRAARQTPQPEDYAEFLTASAAAGSLRPALVGLGIGSCKSELYKRVVMLVQNRPMESRLPRLWTVSVTCAALVLASVAAALSIAPQAAAQGESTGAKSEGRLPVAAEHVAAVPGSAPQSLGKPVAGKNWAIVPLSTPTELQKAFRWNYENASLLVLVNGKALLNDDNTVLNTAPLDIDGLFKALSKYAEAGLHDLTNIEIQGVPMPPQPRWDANGKRIVDESEKRVPAAFVLGAWLESNTKYVTGEVHVSYQTNREKKWNSIVADLSEPATDEAIKQETGVGDDLIKVFPVCTPLSRYLVTAGGVVDANCMIRCVKPMNQLTPEEIRAIPQRAQKYMARLGFKRPAKVCLVENYGEPFPRGAANVKANRLSRELHKAFKTDGVQITMTTAFQVGKAYPKPHRSGGTRVEAKTEEHVGGATLAPPVSPAIVRGKVIDESGKPAAGAEVWLPLWSLGVGLIDTLHAKSDAQGRFALEVGPDWLVKMQPWDRAKTVWAYAAGHQLGTGKVTFPDGPSDMVIRLGPAADTSFVVLNPEGRPFAGALVEPFYIKTWQGIQFPPDELLARVAARTDAEGRVKVPAARSDLLYELRVTTKALGVQSQETPAWTNRDSRSTAVAWHATR